MSTDPKSLHSLQVDAWIQRTTKGVPPERLSVFFGYAMHALWRRSSVTLNDVTLMVIFDRALIICQEEHPLLDLVKLDAVGVNLDELKQGRQYSATQLHQAFRCLIIEIITIVGSLTAEILTAPLYNELSLVTTDSVSSTPKVTHEKKIAVKSERKS